jgi:hypothetical protein
MNEEKILKIAAAISLILLIFWIILTPLVWILRDGLGPDAAESSGLLAIERAFMTFYWGPILILLIILNLIIRKINNNKKG